MYKKFDTKNIFTLLTVLLFIQQTNQIQIGIYLNAHVCKNQQDKFDTLSDIISQQQQQLKIDIIMSLKQNTNEQIIFKSAPNFDITKPLYLVLCEFGKDEQSNAIYEDLSGITSIQDIQGNKCLIDLQSQIYFNINQESPVQFQQNSYNQRYSFGGAKYINALISSQFFQHKEAQLNQELKNLFPEISQSNLNEQEIQEQIETVLVEKSQSDILYNYQLLKILSTGQNSQFYSRQQIPQSGISTLENIQFQSLTDANIIIGHFDKQEEHQHELEAVIVRNNTFQSLLKKFIYHSGVILNYDQINYNGNSKVQQYIKFEFSGSYMSILIKQENQENTNLTEINSLDFMSKSGNYFSLDNFQNEDIEFQVMGCFGFILLNNGDNPIDQINIMNCQPLHTNKNLFKKDNQNQDRVQQIKQAINTSNNLFFDLKLESISVKESQKPESIKVKGFSERCDILYDTILSILFALCYLQFDVQGQFAQQFEKQKQVQDNSHHSIATLNTKLLNGPNLEYIFQTRRILRTGRNNHVECDSECARAYCDCLLLICACIACLLGGGNRRILIKDFSQTSSYTLLKDFDEYDKLMDSIKEKNKMELSEFKQLIDNKQQFQVQTQQFANTIGSGQGIQTEKLNQEQQEINKIKENILQRMAQNMVETTEQIPQNQSEIIQTQNNLTNKIII